MTRNPIVVSLRSALFNLLAVVITLLFSLFFPLLSLRERLFRFRVMSGYARLMITLARLICGIHYRINIHDRQALESGEAFLFAANHQSAYETLLLQLILPPHSWVVKQELLRLPAVGSGLKMLSAVAIDRSRGVESINRIVRDGGQLLDSGLSLLIFPEGTRSKDDSIAPLFPGAVLLAKRSNHRMVPIVHNTGHCWPKNSFNKYPGLVEITVGAPITPTGPSKRANEALHQWMVEEYARLGDDSERAPGT